MRTAKRKTARMDVELTVTLPEEVAAELSSRAAALDWSVKRLAAAILSGERRAKRLFSPGRVEVAEAARRVLLDAGVLVEDVLDRHLSGDPGVCDPTEALGALIAAVERGEPYPVYSLHELPRGEERLTIETDLAAGTTRIETESGYVSRTMGDR